MKTFDQFLLEAKGGKRVVFTFGRLNPPTNAHGMLIDKVSQIAKKKNAEARVYMSHSQDKKKNPLSHSDKLYYLKLALPKPLVSTIQKSKSRTIFEVLEELDREGFSDVILVVGSDRVKQFENLVNQYLSDYAHINSFEVISAGARDADADGVEGLSASKMREAAKNDDFKTFQKGIIGGLSNKFQKELFNKIKQNMS